MILSAVLATYTIAVARDPGSDRFALLVGSNPFSQDLGPRGKALPGTDNDIQCMKQLLFTVWGFNPHNVVVLSGPSATRDNILRELSGLARKVGPNCYGLFYYTGHGVRLSVPAPNEPRIRVAKNFTDFQHYLSGIVDINRLPVWNREINSRLVMAQGDITEIADSCYGGGLSKEGGTVGDAQDADLNRVKTLDSKDVQVKTVVPTIGPEEALSVAIKTDDRRALFAAAGPYAPANEVTLSRQGLSDFQVGCFTAALYRAVSDWKTGTRMSRQNMETQLACGGYQPSSLVPDIPVGDMERYFIAPPVETPRDLSVISGRIPRGLLADAMISSHIFAGSRPVAVSDSDWLSSGVRTKASRVTLKGATLGILARSSGVRDLHVASPAEGGQQPQSNDPPASDGTTVLSVSGKFRAQASGPLGSYEFPAHDSKKAAEDDLQGLAARDSAMALLEGAFRKNVTSDSNEAVYISTTDNNPAVNTMCHLRVDIGDARPEEFLLLAFEPSGTVRVISDAAAYRIHQIDFIASEPTGETRLRLLHVDHAITVPSDFMTTSANANDRILIREKYAEFVEWVGNEIGVSVQASLSSRTILVRH